MGPAPFPHDAGECVTKPPLGLKPEYLWNEDRLKQIIEALQRYSEAGEELPIAWLIELQKRLDEVLKHEMSRGSWLAPVCKGEYPKGD